ncbi:RelA/SpoT family protein [Candidatus Saccharibacteria bacterium]|nr:RelA/SpoT family protein [Candidatus Saccharibacteria bacterium]
MKKSQLLELAKVEYSPSQVETIEKAADLAAKMHAGQKRQSGEPFVSHPLSVAATLIEWEMDGDSVVAGILHDTIEDTSLTLPEIESAFGQSVAFLVDSVTKLNKTRSGMRNIDTYLPQTKDNLTKLLIAMGQDVRAIIIKLADRLHNLQTLQYMPLDVQQKIASESLAIFAPLADRLNMGRVRVQIEELSFMYLDRHEYELLRKLTKKRLSRSHQQLEHVREEVAKALVQAGIKFKMDGRIKSIYSLYKKLQKRDIDTIYDLIALRIIVEDKNACYQVLGTLHALYEPLPGRIKDYIAKPKLNGYQSLHTTVSTPDDQIVEFQIRTSQMHEYAERGLAASFHYNEKKLTDAYKTGQIAAMPANLQWIRDLQEMAAKMREGKQVDTDKMKVNLFSDLIFVHTPKGDIFNLPVGALPLDFAYRVHSDVGNRALSFRVNGKIVGFDEPLKTGDVVEVVTRNNIKPSLDWLNRVKTPQARSKISAELRRQGIQTIKRENPQRKKR